MKKVLLLLVFVLLVNMASAQSQKNKNAFYATGAFNLGNYYGVDINLNYVLKDKYTFKVGYTGNLRVAKSKPEDYLGGLEGVFLLLGTKDPFDQIINYRFDIGRIYKLNESGTIRLNASIGLGYATVREPANWKKRSTLASGFLDRNYSWKYQDNHSFSLIINPKIEFPITDVWGITISPMVQINKYRTYFGIGVGTMLGFLK